MNKTQETMIKRLGKKGYREWQKKKGSKGGKNTVETGALEKARLRAAEVRKNK